MPTGPSALEPGPPASLARLWEKQARRRGGLYLGVGTTPAGTGGLVMAAPQQGALVLGPPRSGKTTTLAIPNVLSAPGPVLSTSTKAEIMAITAATRATLGRCWLFDPSGTTPAPPGVTRIRWSPVASCVEWDDALLTARAMTAAARPGNRRGDAGHWLERAEAMIAPLLHAAALTGGTMRQVQGWVLRQDLDAPQGILSAHGLPAHGLPVTGISAQGPALAADVVAGLAATDHREQSGIFSTTAGVLAAYRSTAVLDGAHPVNFDPRSLAAGRDTVFVCAPAHEQDLLAPITVAFLEAVRVGAYQTARRADRPASPVTLVLDEAANIAPLPGLPSLVSEGGGQGVVTIAFLQDLSQAKHRWGPEAEGFLSLFGAKVILPGIGDVATLDLVSRLAGEIDRPTPSHTRGPRWAGRGARRTETWSMHRQRRLPVDAVHGQAPGTALLLAGSRPPERVALQPWWDLEPFCRASPAPVVANDGAPRAPSPPWPAPRQAATADLGIDHNPAPW